MDLQIAAGPAEYKFVDAAGQTLPAGEFTGYGAVFGNLDAHNDVIEPGAFAESLAQRKGQGRIVPMHVMHGMFGGDGMSVGVWKSVAEDRTGLRVHGKISGISTETGKLLWERLRDGAFGGLSIGYKVADNGAEKRDGKRFLKRLHLGEISLVDDPANALARIDEVKRARLRETTAVLQLPNAERAAAAVKVAQDLLSRCLAGNDTPTADERAALRAALDEAQGHLTGTKAVADIDGVDLTKAFGFLSGFSLTR